MKKPRLLGFAALGLASLAIGAGCGDDDKEESGASTNTTQAADTRGAAAVESGASELRADLTALLEEHVYLAGIAISTGVGGGLDSAAFKAAAGTLDKNSIELSEEIEAAYGGPAGKQFLAIWRDHISFFVDYTKAKAAGDAKGAAAAKKRLDGYRAEFGAFLASANPNLTKEAVAAELKPHVNSVLATIDAVIAKSPETFDRLKEAASHMPGTASVLAGAIVKHMPDKFTGSTDAPGAELRAGLTGLLEEHVYLAGVAISTGAGSGLDSAEFKAAAGTLDQNSIELSKAIESVYGSAAGKQFLAIWRDHISFFVDYTKAKAAGDAKGAAAAKKRLDGYRAEFGAFLASANPELTKQAVAAELKPHVNTVLATIDAVLAKSPGTFDQLRKAASHMPGTAKVLAGAISNQMPEKFGS